MIESEEEELILEVNKVLEGINQNHFISFNNIKNLSKEIPKETGIYIIREKGKSIFYVGSASKQNLYQRLGKNHIKGQGKSVLRKKLAYKGNREEITKYLLENCEYVIYPLTPLDKVLAIEHILIFLLRKKFDLLNDTIDKFK